MAPSLELITIDNTDPRFYPLIGPFLADRAVHRSLGGPPWDDPGRQWTIAVDGDGGAAGFIGCTPTGLLDSLYALPQYRDTLYPVLVEAAVAAAGPRRLRATVSHERTPAYLAAGFAADSTTVNFTRLTRTPS